MPRKPSPERDALIAEIAQKFRRQLEEELPDDTATLDQIEAAAGKIGRQLSENVKTGLRKQSQRTSNQDMNPNS